MKRMIGFGLMVSTAFWSIGCASCQRFPSDCKDCRQHSSNKAYKQRERENICHDVGGPCGGYSYPAPGISQVSHDEPAPAPAKTPAPKKESSAKPPAPIKATAEKAPAPAPARPAPMPVPPGAMP